MDASIIICTCNRAESLLDTLRAHWRSLMEGFLRDAKALDALLIRYEDLVAGRTPLDELESYLNIAIDHNVLNAKVGTSERGGEQAKVSALEVWLLKRAVSPVAMELGYIG
jgi:hypothetical protein